jgi:HEAT repeat protein
LILAMVRTAPEPGEGPPELIEPGADELRVEEAPGEEAAQPGWVAHGDPASIPLLIRYLKDEDEVVKLAALAECASLGPKAKRAVPVILGALRDPKSTIRVEAATTLIHMNARMEEAVRALTKELTAQDARARARAAAAIGDLAAPPEWIFISCWGPDPPPHVVRPWVGKRALPALVEALRDKEPQVRAAAAHTVVRIGPSAISAVSALTSAVRDSDAAVREAATQALKRIDPAAARRVGVRQNTGDKAN